MHVLDPHAIPSVLAQLRALPINTLFAQSVLCGHVDGEVLADHPREPRAVYVLHPYGMSLVWGAHPRPGWDAWLASRVAAPAHPAEWLQVHPDSWRIDAERFTRVNFAFDRARYVRVPGEVVRASAAMFDVAGSVVPSRFWRDAAQWRSSGGGFAALVDGEPAAIAFCSYRHGDALEIGIETVPQHRGKGLARRAASALIDDCLARGLTPVWACRRENVPSYELALRLGFVPTVELPYYRLQSKQTRPSR
jgi:GNAT superfamily N-acetyltransferase